MPVTDTGTGTCTSAVDSNQNRHHYFLKRNTEITPLTKIALGPKTQFTKFGVNLRFHQMKECLILKIKVKVIRKIINFSSIVIG